MKKGIIGICTVMFTLKNGSKKLVRMNAENFAHLVTDFEKKSKSIFKEEFEFSFGGDSFEYNSFGLRRRNGSGFLLEFGAN